MANERVLVVDDSIENNQFVVDYVLKPNEYQALAAFDGEQGLALAIAEQPDLILLDMSMPKMNGLEVLQALKKQGISIPVIMMTFHGSETLAVQVFRLGVKDYVVKPFKVPELLGSIERALSEMRLRRERNDLTERLLTSNHQLEQRVRELNTLFGIGKSVTSVLDQDRLLSRLVEAAVYLTNAEEGSLLLVDETSSELYMVAARGLDDRMAHSFRLRVEDSLAGQVVKSGQPLMLNSEEIKKIKTAYLVRALIYVPLKHKERVRGVLSISNRTQTTEFNNHHLRILSTLADYAVISMENANLFHQAESEHTKLATLLNEIVEPVVVLNNDDDRILFANAAFGRAFNMEAAGLKRMRLSDILKNKALSQFIQAPLAGNNHQGEIDFDNGRIFTVTLAPLLDADRAVIFQDITHFKTLEKTKSEFVSTVSHDLRTPLESVQGYAEMLGQAGTLTEKQQIFLDRITGGVQKMFALVDNLLDLSKVEAGVEGPIERVNLTEVVRKVVAKYQPEADQKQQQLVYHVPAEAALVNGNQARLQQMIAQLIGNALKFTPRDGQVSVILQIDEQQILCKVEDNGLGIPPADLPFIFDKFYRIESEGHPELSGTGLGLALCKSIIEQYDGSIWAESDPQRGSIFAFMLPLASSAALSPEAILSSVKI